MRAARESIDAASPGTEVPRPEPTDGCVSVPRPRRAALAVLCAVAALVAPPTSAAWGAPGGGPSVGEAKPSPGPRPGPLTEGAGPAASAPTPPDTTERAPLPERPWEAWLRDGVALASLLTMDRPVRIAARDLAETATEESAVDRIADRAEWFGDWEGSLPWIVGGSLAVGQLTGGERGLREGAALLAGGAAASMVNEALNRAVGRGRPSWEEGPYSLEPFRGHAAFPSGHTAYVFGVASGIDVVTDGWLPAAAAYGVAGLTGLSRIYHDRHWLTDVVASATLSTVVSRLATRRALGLLGVRDDGGRPGAGESVPPAAASEPADLRRAPPTSPDVRVEPLFSPRVIGVAIRF